MGNKIWKKSLPDGISVLRKDFHDDNGIKKDTMWMVRFTSSMDVQSTQNNIHHLLCKPVEKITEWCDDINIPTHSFKLDQPINITFTYGSKAMKWEKGSSDDPEYVAYGMHGSNNIYVQCPDIQIKDDLSDPDFVQKYLINQGITFNPLLDIVAIKDTHSIIAHYDFMNVDEFQNGQYVDSEGQKVNRVTSFFLLHPYIFVACLNKAKIRSSKIVDIQSGIVSPDADDQNHKYLFHLRNASDTDQEPVGFQFVFQTLASTPDPSTATQIPSDCITFTASYDLNDPNSSLGTFIAQLNNGQQMRWIPMDPLNEPGS
jgi:hypothetical protein